MIKINQSRSYGITQTSLIELDDGTSGGLFTGYDRIQRFLGIKAIYDDNLKPHGKEYKLKYKCVYTSSLNESSIVMSNFNKKSYNTILEAVFTCKRENKEIKSDERLVLISTYRYKNGLSFSEAIILECSKEDLINEK